jgi:hypothetical protein
MSGLILVLGRQEGLRRKRKIRQGVKSRDQFSLASARMGQPDKWPPVRDPVRLDCDWFFQCLLRIRRLGLDPWGQCLDLQRESFVGG